MRQRTDEPANDNVALGSVHTLNEAAHKLRMSRRALQDTIKRLPFYAKNGKVYLFSDSDIVAIWNGMRCDSICTEEALKEVGTSAARTRKARPSSNLQRRIDEMLRKRSA